MIAKCHCILLVLALFAEAATAQTSRERIGLGGAPAGYNVNFDHRPLGLGPRGKLHKALLEMAAMNPYRKHSTNVYDLGPRILWNELRLFNIPTTEKPLPDWEFVHGKVMQLTADGILFHEYADTDFSMEGDDELVFIKNFPKNIPVVDGDNMAFYAMQSGRHQYLTALGSSKTIWSYDYGTIPSDMEIQGLRNHAAAKKEFAEAARKEAARAAQQKEQEKRAGQLHKTIEYYRARADTNSFAQYRLGDLLLQTNHEEALQWLRRAASNGNADAAARLKTIPQ